MALWGNKDNIESPGTVTVNYATNIVTGAGTSFGLLGNNAREGDVISFGVPFSGAATNYGDAVIVEILSSTELRILNTDGLSGVEITNQQYQIAQSPKYLPADAAQNQSPDAFQQVDVIFEGKVDATVAAGATTITVTGGLTSAGVVAGQRARAITIEELHQGDILTIAEVVSDTELNVTEAIPTTQLNYQVGAGLGVTTTNPSTIVIQGNAVDPDPNLNSPDEVRVGDLCTVTGKGITNAAVTSVNPNSDPDKKNIGVASTISTALGVGDELIITRGIANGNTLKVATINTYIDGMSDNNTVGVATAGVDAALGTSYQVISAGWVGVTTYTDCNGNARVKSETFVAMSGIQTGNTNYPPV